MTDTSDRNERIRAALQKAADQMRDEALATIANLDAEKAELERREREIKAEIERIRKGD